MTDTTMPLTPFLRHADQAELEDWGPWRRPPARP